ncbi:hypothetical protein K438DRAFT_2029176 [Mycena galopus ATCC 62051]|nr:hypothetical protein K438DRAFT_2029176 [Mycena galopus ATCC 62051]
MVYLSTTSLGNGNGHAKVFDDDEPEAAAGAVPLGILPRTVPTIDDFSKPLAQPPILDLMSPAPPITSDWSTSLRAAPTRARCSSVPAGVCLRPPLPPAPPTPPPFPAGGTVAGAALAAGVFVLCAGDSQLHAPNGVCERQPLSPFYVPAAVIVACGIATSASSACVQFPSVVTRVTWNAAGSAVQNAHTPSALVSALASITASFTRALNAAMGAILSSPTSTYSADICPMSIRIPKSSANFCSQGLDTGAMLAMLTKRASNPVMNAAHVPNAAPLNHTSAATPLIAKPSSTSFKKSIAVVADVRTPVNVGPILMSSVAHCACIVSDVAFLTMTIAGPSVVPGGGEDKGDVPAIDGDVGGLRAGVR